MTNNKIPVSGNKVKYVKKCFISDKKTHYISLVNEIVFLSTLYIFHVKE